MKGFLKLEVNVTWVERVVTGGYRKKKQSNFDVVSRPSKPIRALLFVELYLLYLEAAICIFVLPFIKS